MRYLIAFIKVLVIVSIIVIFFWALLPSNSPTWTGFGPYNEVIDGPRSKTLWDWLELLVVPAFLAIGASILSSMQKQSDKVTELDRQRQSTLISFFDQISKLLLEEKLRKVNNKSEPRVLARTYSRLAFRNLDGKRKAEALQFLCEAGLISHNPILSLNAANLTATKLKNARLENIEIQGAYFGKADFTGANLTDSNFCGCDLTEANFEDSVLTRTNLSYSNLSNSNFKNVNLTTTNLQWSILDGANLKNAKIKSEQLKSIKSCKNAKMPQKLID